jgi:AraC-like DNA-binding protein
MDESDKILYFSAMLKDLDHCRVMPGHHGRVRCEPGWSLAPEWSDRLQDYDLWWVWAGAGVMRLRDREVELRPGVCFWMRPGGRYLGSQDADNRLGVSYLHFHLATGQGPLAFQDDSLPEVYYPADPVGFDALFNRTMQLLGSAPDSPLTSGLLRCLIMELVYAHENDPHRSHDPAAARIREQMMRWREQPGAIPSVSELAREAGFAVDHYTRCFVRLSGMTPREWRITIRLDRAQRLLAETSLSISQIADLLGYGDVFHFSKQFKARLGHSPKRYRQRGAG